MNNKIMHACLIFLFIYEIIDHDHVGHICYITPITRTRKFEVREVK